ncbi:MAG: DUF885 domain-containing protein [Lachnospiraceae bacterium]|nr:DUF885 domain-containing protein [Lachnospiraceae bacterium]
MKPYNKLFYRLLILCISLCFLLSGCSQKSAKTDFDTFTEELFLEEVCTNTINLHYTLAYPKDYGIEDYPVSLGDFTMEDLENYTEELLTLQKELRAFDDGTLSFEQQLTYDILDDYIETELSASDLYLYDEVLSPAIGYQAQLPVLLAEYTFRTEKDISDYLELASQIDDIFDTLIEFERTKSAAGLFMADFAVDDIVTQMQNFIASPSDNYMLAVFNDKIDAFPDLTDEARRQYKEQHDKIVTESIIPAYQKLIDALTELKGTGRNPGGLCYLPEGDSYYEYLVRSKTGSSKSVKQLMGNVNDFIMDALTQITVLSKENPELLSAFASSCFTLTDPEEIMEDLISKVSNDFPEAPNVTYTIKQIHESMQKSSSPAFYLTPPIDDIENNIIYINPLYMSADIYPTMAHEGYPGHLYQTVYTSSRNLPLVRNLFSCPGYTEGWATYVEYYSYGISGLDEDIAELYALDAGASLALHAYIDLCVNYDGWDADEVYSYLSQFGYDDKSVAEEVFQAMVEDPANYLSYFIGYLEFIELREQAEKLYGDEFTLKEFHDTVLTLGPAPFDILSRYITRTYKETH